MGVSIKVRSSVRRWWRRCHGLSFWHAFLPHLKSERAFIGISCLEFSVDWDGTEWDEWTTE